MSPGAMHMSVQPWTLGSPRRAASWPPGTPMLPSSSWTIDMLRVLPTPVECWVWPRAYRIVPALSVAPVDV
jgi:hypothetical protein